MTELRKQRAKDFDSHMFVAGLQRQLKPPFPAVLDENLHSNLILDYVNKLRLIRNDETSQEIKLELNINGFEDYLETHFFDEEKSRKLTKRLIKDFVNTLATYPKLFNKKTSLEKNIFEIIRRLLAHHWNVSDYDGCKEVLDLAKNIPVHDKKQLENFIAKMTKTIHIKIKLSDIEAIHDDRRRNQKTRDLLHFIISKDVYWDGNGLSRKEKELYRILLTEISNDDAINDALVKNYDQITHPAKKYKSEIIEGNSWIFYLPFEFYNLNLTKIYDHLQRSGLNEKKSKDKSLGLLYKYSYYLSWLILSELCTQ